MQQGLAFGQLILVEVGSLFGILQVDVVIQCSLDLLVLLFQLHLELLVKVFYGFEFLDLFVRVV